ncbi:MAG: Abi family protein [Akkermansia muciniphila]
MDPVQKDADMSASSISLKKYGDSHQHLPLWMFSEISDFGFTSLFFEHAGRDIQTEIAKEWAVTPEVLRSWMRSLNTLRNTCAHHGRLWNNVWGTPPKLPPWHSQRGWYARYSLEKRQWILPQNNKSIQPSFAQDRTAMLLFICRYLLKKIIPCTEWPKRMENLFSDFSNKGIDFPNMGFSNSEWQKHPIWKNSITSI